MAQEGEYSSTNELRHCTYYFLVQIEAVISRAIANAPFFRPKFMANTPQERAWLGAFFAAFGLTFLWRLWLTVISANNRRTIGCWREGRPVNERFAL
jgi:hypothetical protein